MAAGCSTKKNTANTRWWHSFTARYNTYYNGSQAYIEGSLEKENGNKDNFTEIIPLYTVGNKASRELGKGNFDRAIEKSEKAIKQHSIKRRPTWNKSRRKTAKDIEWLNRKEYNPFLWKAWLLMGKSQFQKGEFDEAAATFSYMSRLYATQPQINGIARAWLAKCYTELDWLYDAEDVITKMKRDTMHYKAVKEWDYTYADYYIRSKQYDEAVKYLAKVIKHERRKKQKAREWFLMGQLQTRLGNRQAAYKAYGKVVRQNPPYEVEFNARIAQTEVMAGGRSKQMIKRLRRMAKSDKNKDYLDQVYYAIGNIYLAGRDTLNAISAYERGNKESTRSGIEKGVLLLKLGDLYWAREKYNDAQRCYGEAIGLLDKDRPDYALLSKRSEVLDELVPFTDAVYLQDSLQVLAKLPEAERNKAIDRVIEELKKKEEEEKRAAQEAAAEQQLQQQGAVGNQLAGNRLTSTQQQKGGTWYFYNPMTVNQGKAAFQKQWGKRENVDNWQRINQTVVNLAAGEQPADSLAVNTEGGMAATNRQHRRRWRSGRLCRQRPAHTGILPGANTVYRRAESRERQHNKGRPFQLGRHLQRQARQPKTERERAHQAHFAIPRLREKRRGLVPPVPALLSPWQQGHGRQLPRKAEGRLSEQQLDNAAERPLLCRKRQVRRTHRRLYIRSHV